MKKFTLTIMITFPIAFMLFSGCTRLSAGESQIAEMPTVIETESEESSEGTINMPDFSIYGKYICSSDYFSVEFFLEKHSEAVPFIYFNEDGKCIFRINYLGGVCEVNGFYNIEKDLIYVDLHFDGTVFIDKETAETYIPTEYIFSIVSNDEIVIGDDCYGVRAGDSFLRVGGKTTIQEEDVAAEYGRLPSSTGVEKDGYKEFLYTRVVIETENWIDFTPINSKDTIKHTIMLPDEYDFMGPTVFFNAGQKVSELSFVVRLKEGQRMPETLEGFGLKLGPHDQGCIRASYYDEELLSAAGVSVFLAREIVEPFGGDESIQVWYPHTFYVENSGFVFAITFYPLVEYPEEDVMDAYMKIATSIELVN